ncbi:hypothetical protein AA313_de0210405 [Arthrobotrys entomopaga]|nr:hypothetical protein AA313_de0210405 [Arthrobotrys entomopaga]
MDDTVDDKHLFYWFLESKSNPKADPILLWLSGGPGAASTAGMIYGIGPRNYFDTYHDNPYTWNQKASIIFLDQPTNVGFSYGKNTTSTKLAAKEVYALLSMFFEKKPEYSKQPFYIWGVSYGGHWVPAFANEILSHPDNKINLKGAIIANGITDQFNQVKHMPDMVCGKGGHKAIFNATVCKEMQTVHMPQAQKLITDCNKNSNRAACIAAEDYWQDNFIKRVEGLNISSSNLNRPKDVDGPGPAEKLFNKPEVRKALGVDARAPVFNGMRDEIHKLFHDTGDVALSMIPYVKSVIEKIPILVYAGDKDYICDWMGVKAWTEALDWSGKAQYNRTPLKPYKLAGSSKEVGQIKSLGRLTYARIYNGSHAAYYESPEAVLQLVNNFMSPKSQQGRLH